MFTNKFSNFGKVVTSKAPRNELALIGVIVLFGIILSFLTPHFHSMTNLFNLSRQISTFAIIGVGMCYVIISGEIDLSVGSVLGLSAVVMALLVSSGLNCILALIIALLSGIAIGILNGVLTTKARIPSLVVTLGTLSVARGIALTITDGWPVNLYGRLPEWFLFLGGGRVYGLPMQAVFMVIVLISGFFILHKTSLGYQMYAIGGNPRAAMLYGIAADKIRILAFAITGFLASLAGILALSFIQVAEPNLGFLTELDIIAAVVIGGTLFRGGQGSILGVLLGALIMGILYNGLVLLGVSVYVQRIFIGIIIIMAVFATGRSGKV